MRLTFPLYLHQFMLINVNIVPTQLFVIVIYVKQMVVSNYISSTSKPVSIKTVCKRIVSCNRPVILLQFTNLVTMVILVLVRMFVAVLAVSTLILLNPLLCVKLFVAVMLV